MDNSDRHMEFEKRIRHYFCPACGTEVFSNDLTEISICYNCQNQVLISEPLSKDYMPEMVIPFSLDLQQAEKGFADWFKSKKTFPLITIKTYRMEVLQVCTILIG